MLPKTVQTRRPCLQGGLLSEIKRAFSIERGAWQITLFKSKPPFILQPYDLTKEKKKIEKLSVKTNKNTSCACVQREARQQQQQQQPGRVRHSSERVASKIHREGKKENTRVTRERGLSFIFRPLRSVFRSSDRFAGF